MSDALSLWIRSGRAGKGLSQKALAQSVGVGVPYISKIEAGKEHPGEELLRRIGATLDLDPDELLIASGRVPAYLMRALSRHPAEAVIALQEFAIQHEWKGSREEGSV